MKYLCTLILLASCYFSSAQKVEYKPFADIDSFFNNTNDTLYVVNFWATWCKPCIEELPGFEKVNSIYAGKNVKVILISLDAQMRWESSLVPFLQLNKLKSTVWSIYKERPENWIDNIDTRWQGTIPATIIFNNTKSISYFHETEISFDQLNNKITELINQ